MIKVSADKFKIFAYCRVGNDNNESIDEETKRRKKFEIELEKRLNEKYKYLSKKQVKKDLPFIKNGAVTLCNVTDGDEEYLERCMDFYKKNKIKAYGLFMREGDMPNQVGQLLKKYNPDILVLTGHDSFSRNKRTKYKNTSSFVDAVIDARKYEKGHDKLFIIAGACQSNYEELIKAGANFASSPKRINIHALDPAIVAACLSFSDKNNNIDIIKILDKTKYGADGMGGIITKGSMYIGYPR